MTETALDDDLETVCRAYQRWAPVYDVVWGAVLEQARREAADAAQAVGGRILEIGIGTGLSLEHYRGPDVELFGVDVCSEMLDKARQRAREHRYPFLKQLQVMDAHRLAFPDAFFDCVVAQFVITVVERPEQVLSECARVVRPGGEIVLVNRFYSDSGLAARIERWASGPLRKVGLRPEFSMGRLVRWTDQDSRVELSEARKIGISGSCALVRCRRLP